MRISLKEGPVLLEKWQDSRSPDCTEDWRKCQGYLGKDFLNCDAKKEKLGQLFGEVDTILIDLFFFLTSVKIILTRKEHSLLRGREVQNNEELENALLFFFPSSFTEI